MKTTIFAGFIASMSMTLLIGIFQSQMVTAGQVKEMYDSIHNIKKPLNHAEILRRSPARFQRCFFELKRERVLNGVDDKEFGDLVSDCTEMTGVDEHSLMVGGAK